MGKIFLIGGTARVGKSTLAARLRTQISGQSISGDAVAQALRSTFGEARMPQLFVHKGLSAEQFEQLPIDERLHRLRARDQAIWDFGENYIAAILHDSVDDILYEGGLWPDFLVDSAFEYRVVFLVDTSKDRAEFLKHIRDTSSESSNDWMRDQNYTDERIEAWAKFDVERSRRIIELCEKHDMPYFDIAEYGIGKAQELAEQALLEAITKQL